MTITETLGQLVAIDSVSSRANTTIISYLENRCRAKGLATRTFSYTDETGAAKTNLIALASAEFSFSPAVELALVGHTDTVPYSADWAEALTLTEREGKHFGRGACDTKGFIAAALTAVENTDLNSLKSPLALVFTADEEIGCLGAKQLSQLRPFKVRYAVVGEPTSLQPMRAGKGYCLGEVVVRGREGHSAYPALGASAIFRAARLITRLERIAEELQADQRSEFNPPYTTLNIGVIRGGTAKNVIAGECRFTLEWRPVPRQKPTHLLELLDQAIAAEKDADASFDCDVNVSRVDGGFETSADSRLTKLLEQVSGQQSGTIAFGTEVPQMIELGAEAIVFGPGDIRAAHRTGEFVTTDHLQRCTTALMRIIERCCG